MQVPYNWLKEYINFPYSPKELSHKFTMAGLEVEGFKYLGEGLKDIIIGEIIKVSEHPNADKLKICKVDIKDKELQMISGAPNIKEKIKVPIAQVGVTLPTGMKIEETKLRGELSQGMICSKDELGLQKERASGIMILDQKAKIGQKFIDYYGLDEYVYKLDLTPNYARCLGLIGIAREVRAMTDDSNSIEYPEIKINENSKIKTEEISSVEIEDQELCPRYAGRVIQDVTIKPSPEWMQNRLKAAGIRPINNIVDITNYVLLEYNQPLHAFDLEKIKNGQIIVRRAKQNEEVVTLDDLKRTLDQDTLVITDPEKVIAVAGVMGAANSEVTKNTKDIFLEAAYFKPTSIRKTARKLGLPSEASHRFERGIDIENVIEAGNRAVYLMQKYADGKVTEGVIDSYPNKYQEKIIRIDTDKVNRLLGISLDSKQIEEMLNKLEIEVLKIDNSKLKLKVPSYRNDIEQDADIIEEVARIYGYNNILSTRPETKQIAKRSKKQKIEKEIKNIMNGAGLDEIITFSLTGPKDYKDLDLPKKHQYKNWVKIKNPLNKAFGLLRTSLLPGLIKSISLNAKRQIEELRYFEVGRVFFNNGEHKRPIEKTKLALGSMGVESDLWQKKAPNFYYLKGVLEELFDRLKILEEISFVSANEVFTHPGRTADIIYKDKKIGFLAELKPSVIDSYDLKTRTAVSELDLSEIFNDVELGNYVFEILPKYPGVERDLSVVLTEEIPLVEIINLINNTNQEILKKVELFDIYRGEQIEENKKSIAFKLMFQAPDRTLIDQEVNKVFDQIVERLKDSFKAEIRKK